MELLFQEIVNQLNTVSFVDKVELQNRLHAAVKIVDFDKKQTYLLEVEQALKQAQQKIEIRSQSVPVITYPDALPVSQKKEEIRKTIAENQVVIVAGEAGSGKTTQLPKICLELGLGIKGVIGHTQPRRLAARSVANRLVEELNTIMGAVVGYKIRFSDQIGETTLIKLMTDGVLLAEIQQDKLLRQYDTIIIDEAHERSLNIDFILGYLRKILPERPDLKIIITSATIDPEKFSKHFNNAPIIEVSGRTYPVEVRYRPIVTEIQREEERDLLQAIIDAVDELNREAIGDILIFMSGEREIRDTADALNKLDLQHTEVLPLYARLSASEQNRVFQSYVGRRIILATNVAETSLTIPGIKYVIDPGSARISRYSYRTKVQRLPIEAISQASAKQRAGRCGRLSEGIAIRLYSEVDLLSRPEFTEPEITRTNLASVVLQMMALRLGKIDKFPFLEAPDQRNINDGLKLLEELDAIESDKKQGYRLKESGKQLAKLPLDPRLAKMVLTAQKMGCVHEVMIITAALSIQDPRERPAEKQKSANEKHLRFMTETSDFMSYLLLWEYVKEQQKSLTSNQFRRLCRTEFLNYLRLKEWQDIYTQLRQTVKELRFSVNSTPADFVTLHRALLSGLLSHVGMKNIESNEYLGARNLHFHLHPSSNLFKKTPKWIITAELVETTRLWGRTSAKIEPEWIESLAKHLLKYSYSEPHWKRSRGAVVAKEQVTLYGLPIIQGRDVYYANIDPIISRDLFIRSALIDGDWKNSYNFIKENDALRDEVEELEHRSRRRDILVDDETLYHFYEERIPKDVVSAKHFETWWQKVERQEPDKLLFQKNMLIKEGASRVTQEDYPTYWRQGNLKFKLSYIFDPTSKQDGINIHIPLIILNQVKDEGFDWLVPGFRKELIISWIKTLPKSLRRHFVPAPNYAQALIEKITPYEAPLLTTLEQALFRMTGVKITEEDWQEQLLPHHLKLTFCIENDENQMVMSGDFLLQLKEQLKGEMKQSLSARVESSIERTSVTTWDFGTLPSVYKQKQGELEITAYPALVDNNSNVDIQLCDSFDEQQQAMKAGIRRLILVNIPSPIHYLQHKLPNRAKLGLYFNPFGNVMDVINDCIACAVDKLVMEQGGIVWEQDKFSELLRGVKGSLNDTVIEIAKLTEKILTQTHALNKQLKKRLDMAQIMIIGDVKQQLDELIYKGFLTETGWGKLPNLLRYLQAIERRLEKLSENPQRDREHFLKVEVVQNRYKQWKATLPQERRKEPAVVEIRWMIEELRVSYFAQQLGTAYPISEKRILQAIEQFS